MHPKYRVDYRLSPLEATISSWDFRGNLMDSVGNNHLSYDPIFRSIVSDDYIAGKSEDDLTSLFINNDIRAIIPAASSSDFNFGMNSFTIETIFRSTYLYSIQLFINKQYAVSGYSIILDGNNKVVFRIGDGTKGLQINGISSISSEWNYVAIVVDRENDVINTYINGVSDVVDFDISTLTGPINPSAYDLQIGKGGTGYGAGTYMVIDQIMFTQEVLSSMLIERRNKGIYNPVSYFESNYLTSFLPEIHWDNDDIEEFSIPFTTAFRKLKSYAEFVPFLSSPERCPTKFLTHLATTIGSELADINTFSISERKSLLNWMIWIYNRKGTIIALEKLLEIIGFDSSTITEIFKPDVFAVYNLSTFASQLTGAKETFYDSLNMGLSQWNKKLNFNDKIFIEDNNHMSFRAGAPFGSNHSAILFDSDTDDFLFECEFTENSSQKQINFYLDYVDYQNYIVAEILDLGSNYLFTVRRVYGGSGLALIINSTTDNYVDYDTKLKFWCRISKRLGTVTVGINEFVFGHVSFSPQSVYTFLKKGVGGNNGADIDFDNVRVYSYSPYGTLSRLYDSTLELRKLQIDVDGITTNPDAKYEWLQRIVPNYVPSGVEIEWTASY